MSITDKLKELMEKYESNEYMINRLHHHINHILPNTLEAENDNYNDRIQRTNILQTTQETFIKVFLDKHKYYYLSSSGNFYEYADNTYVIIKEDDILHKLLTTISEDRVLMDWKYKTKTTIIRRIKERNLLSSTPNTETIQHVLNALYPAFFPSKNATKYFLTVVGDNILKKQTFIRVINKHAHLFYDIDCLSSLIGASSITTNFASKYNDSHVYNQYRLLQVNEHFSQEMWYNVIGMLHLDFLCVAAHYSNRYSSSEKFIETIADNNLKQHIMYLQTNSQEQIITRFIEHSTQPADITFHITWKQLHYIWKQYLGIQVLPNMMYSYALKQSLVNKLQYDEANDSFLNITSKYLPMISKFLQFWEHHIHLSTNNELEISELYALYNLSTTMKEHDILKLVKHFYPEIVVVDNKYILGIECDLWNKQTDIQELIEWYKQNKPVDIVSIDEMYEKYTARLSGTEKRISSKRYFEKYIRSELKEYIVYETFFQF